MTLVHRGEELSAREQFAGEIKACDGLRLILQTTVTRFHGAARLEGVTLSGPGGGEEQEVDAALVRIGWQPNSGRLPPSWLDQSGFVRRTGEVQSSESPRIFVAGEVGGGISPAVVSAFGSGAAAAAAAVRYLEGGESNGPG